MSWKTIKKVKLPSRDAEIQENGDGDYRIRTTTSVEDDGLAEVDENSILIIPPTPAGSPVDIDVEDIATLPKDLEEVGITDSEADTLLEEIRTLMTP